MSVPSDLPVVAFVGAKRIARASLLRALPAIHAAAAAGEGPLVFNLVDGRPVDLDLRGDLGEARVRLGPPLMEVEKRGPGRPKLGVTAREVTLLPRHWSWLNAQPGGASVALRRLVEAARRDGGGDERRQRQEATYRFMHAIAGNAPGFEEAARALFAADLPRFEDAVVDWPHDVREHATMLAARAMRD